MLKEFEPIKIDLQLFADGEGAEDDPNKSQETNQDTDPNTEPGSVANDNPPKTQEELDAIIEKRLERERRKLAKQQRQQQKQANTQNPDEGDEGTTQTTPELENLNRELLMARAQLEAFRNGIRPDVVEDAVYLALRTAEKDGEVDEEDIKEALKSVLKRHPEWKSDSSKQGEGFKVGATGGKHQEPATNDVLAEIFGNKK